MSVIEKETSSEVLSIVLNALKKGLESFEHVTSFSEGSDSSVNYREKEDFRSLTALAVAAQALDSKAPEWRRKVDSGRQRLKAEMIELGDIITAIEIDQVFIEYLLAVDELDQAIVLARNITAGYTVPDPMSKVDQGKLAVIAARMQLQQFEEKKVRALVDVAYKLVIKGDLVRAAESVERVDLTNEGHLYFAGILSHHKKNGDVRAITDFIVDMDRRAALSQEDVKDYRQSWVMLIMLSNQAKESIAQIQARTGNIDSAMQRMMTITVGGYRVREQTTFMEQLLKEGNDAPARELALAIINDLNKNTSHLADKKFGKDDDEAEKDEEIGSLDFLRPKLNVRSDENQYEFRNYDRAEALSLLAKTLARFPQCRDLFDLCINGLDGDRGIIDSIRLSNRDIQSSLWSNLITVFGTAGEREKLEETYRQGCELYPDSIDFLTMKYAYALYDFDQNSAMELILSNPDLEQRVDGFAAFVRAQIEENGFSDWQKLITKLVNLEDAILLPLWDEKEEFSIHDLAEDQDGGDGGSDQQVITSASTGGYTFYASSGQQPTQKFLRTSPALLANLSKLAIIRGEWDAFDKIFKDQRMSPKLKVLVLSEVTDWLQKGVEIVFWF